MDLLHTSSPRRWRLAAWGVLAVVVGFLAWGGWRWADERAAVREARAAGFLWQARDPAEVIAVIRADWRAAFRRSTWDFPRELNLRTGADLARLRPLLLRLRPTRLVAYECPDRNLDALRGLTSLQRLYLYGCTGLQNVDGLRGLTGLHTLDLDDCTGLQNVDGLRGLTSLHTLDLDDCTGLQNVDGLHGLTGLQRLDLNDCTGLRNVDGLRGLRGLQWLDLDGCRQLAPTAMRELAAALPETRIVFPDGSTTPPW